MTTPPHHRRDVLYEIDCFIGERCNLGDNLRATPTQLLDAWTAWPNRTLAYLSARTLTNVLVDRGHRRTKSNGVRLILGIAPKGTSL